MYGAELVGNYELAASGALGPIAQAAALAPIRAAQYGRPGIPATRPVTLNPNAARTLGYGAELVQAAAQQAAIAQGMRESQSVAVTERSFTRGGEVPAGFKSTTDVDAGATVNIRVTAPVLFKPKRLLVPDSIAPSFELVSCVVGMDSQLVTAEPIPAEAFSQDSVNQGWRIETLQIGQAIDMVWRNISGAPCTLRGCWLGLYAT